MQNIRRKFALKILEISDLVLMIACFFAAAYGSYKEIGPVSFGDFLSMRVKVINFISFTFFLLIWHYIFVLSGLYRSKRLSGAANEIKDVLKATIAGSAVLFVLGRVMRISLLTPHFTALFLAASSIAIISARLMLRSFLKTLRLRGRNIRRLLIVGTNRRAVEYAKKIESRPDLGYRIAGFVENGWSHNTEFRQSGYTVVTNFANFREFIRTSVVDEVMVCLPMKSHYQISLDVVKSCEEQGIIVRFLSDFFNLELARSRAENLAGDSVITIYTGAMMGWPVLVKRAIDVAFSLALLIFLTPWLALIAALIKISSPGPALFVQERVGLNKRRFRLYKFRTMVPDAEGSIKDLVKLNEVSGPVFKIRNDPRVTWIGKYLRKTSIDELPQLINVLKGDMSLVGPRPLPLRDYEGFDEDWQRRRFSVRPGITCLWQVGGRSDVSFDRWMGLDMEYIDNWSLWLDFKILAQTIPAVLKGSGAA
jgi:exopolysaccharide biosynthesis polyprenyl glycosylphosphotransferase